jgi:hypothetical protein
MKAMSEVTGSGVKDESLSCARLSAAAAIDWRRFFAGILGMMPEWG